MNKFLGGLTVATALLLSAPAGAITVFTSSLDGTQEVPPKPSAAFGSSTLTLDGAMLDIDLSWSGLSGVPTGAHIHCCSPVGVNAMIKLDFFDAIPKVASGSYVDSFDLITDLSGISPEEFIAGLNGGLAYLNLHTALNPGGEIRGQVFTSTTAPIPEPASYALMLAGLAAAGALAARRGVRA